MSEEIKDIILDVKDSLNETPKNMYKYNKITLNLNEFEEILNYIEQLEKEIDRLNNIINELEKWLKQRYKKTEENSSRMKDITYLNREFYITVKNVQSDRKDILDKLKELKEGDKE